MHTSSTLQMQATEVCTQKLSLVSEQFFYQTSQVVVTRFQTSACSRLPSRDANVLFTFALTKNFIAFLFFEVALLARIASMLHKRRVSARKCLDIRATRPGCLFNPIGICAAHNYSKTTPLHGQIASTQASAERQYNTIPAVASRRRTGIMRPRHSTIRRKHVLILRSE